MNKNLDKNQSEWRILVKLTGISQLGGAIVGLIAVIFLVVFCASDSIGPITFTWALYLVAATLVTTLIVAAWSGNQLIEATYLGGDIGDGYRRCRSWQTTNLVLHIVLDVVLFYFIFVALDPLHGIFYVFMLVISEFYCQFVVYRFMGDLRKAASEACV